MVRLVGTKVLSLAMSVELSPVSTSSIFFLKKSVIHKGLCQSDQTNTKSRGLSPGRSIEHQTRIRNAVSQTALRAYHAIVELSTARLRLASPVILRVSVG